MTMPTVSVLLPVHNGAAYLQAARENPELLRRFVTESGKILPRRVTGMSARIHRKITREIKRARAVLLMK